MTPTSLFILTTCCLTAILAIVLLLWHRESRRLGASNADAEARERDAAARLSAAEARLAAAEQAVSAERELRQRYEAQAQALTEQRTRTEAELAALRASSETELASLRAKNAEERAAEKAEREKLEETFRAQFKNLATEILGEHSVRFRQTSQEQIDSLLKPFRDNITDFRKRVEEIYTTQTSQRGELKAELKNLMELNRRITAETTNLTNALKGNSKVQGDWGEMLLETILDSSALIKGIHYQTQYNIKDEEGRNLRPDVVLHLPEKKDIVIDSKVSLTAFVGYTSRRTWPRCASTSPSWAARSTSGGSTRPTSSSCSYPTNRHSSPPCRTIRRSGRTPTTGKSSSPRRRTCSPCSSWWPTSGNTTIRTRTPRRSPPAD